MERSATISNCGKYRYELIRIWDNTKPRVMFIMLNPSTADGEYDDATIRRSINFAKSWGYGSLIVCNLYAYRSTDPKGLLNVDDPVGSLNEATILKNAELAGKIVLAWGNSPIVKKLRQRNESSCILDILDRQIRNVNHLGLSIDGTPKHPLYLKSNTPLQQF